MWRGYRQKGLKIAMSSRYKWCTQDYFCKLKLRNTTLNGHSGSQIMINSTTYVSRSFESTLKKTAPQKNCLLAFRGVFFNFSHTLTFDFVSVKVMKYELQNLLNLRTCLDTHNANKIRGFSSDACNRDFFCNCLTSSIKWMQRTSVSTETLNLIFYYYNKIDQSIM